MKLYFSPRKTVNLQKEVLMGPFSAMFFFQGSTSLFLADLPLQIWSGEIQRGQNREREKAIGNDPLHTAFASRGKKGARERPASTSGGRGRADFGTLRKTGSTKPDGGEPSLRAPGGPLAAMGHLTQEHLSHLPGKHYSLHAHCLLLAALKPTLDSSAPI